MVNIHVSNRHDRLTATFCSGTIRESIYTPTLLQRLIVGETMADDAKLEGSGSEPTFGQASEESDGGIEPDVEETENERIDHPFNPEKIKVQTVPIVVEQLVSRIRHEEIDLQPDFQRLRGIWGANQKSRLVESILLRIPLPVFYVAADDQDDWSVVDGLQRMSTIYDYVSDQFSLVGLEYLTHFHGKTHRELPNRMRRRISETQLVVNVIDPGTPGEVMFNIFHRINTGGMTLNGQEIRHALNRGPVREFLKNLAETEEFLKATNDSISPKRMADRDCVLRFLAFYPSRWKGYANNDVDGYLDDTMKSINRMTEQERASVAAVFKKAMLSAYDIFGNQAFRKPPLDDGKRRPINKALFGAWSVGLARRSSKEVKRLVRNRVRVEKKFKLLLKNDREFDTAISYSTGTPGRVRKQFQAIDDLIGECI